MTSTKCSRLIGVETPNIAAGLRWWLATDRATDVLECFDQLPFVDAFALPTIALDELSAVASAAIAAPGNERRGASRPRATSSRLLMFMSGDIDDYRRLQARGECVRRHDRRRARRHHGGDVRRRHTGPAVEHAELAVDLARAEGADAQLAWLLAQLTMMESIRLTRRAMAMQRQLAMRTRRSPWPDTCPGTIVAVLPLRRDRRGVPDHRSRARARCGGGGCGARSHPAAMVGDDRGELGGQRFRDGR